MLGRDLHPGRTRPRFESGDDPLAHDADVLALVELPAESLVEPTQHLDLVGSQRRIAATGRRRGLEQGRIDADGAGEAIEQGAGRRTVGREHDDVDPFGCDLGGPGAEDLLQVEAHPERRGGGHRTALGVAHRGEELRPRPGPALADLLLPQGGQHPGEVANGHDHMHLGVAEIVDELADLAAVGDREQLLGEDRPVALPVPDLRGQRIPGAWDPPTLRATWAAPEQVGGGPPGRGLALAGDQAAGLRKGASPVPHRRLEERRSRLRQPDVDVDTGAHAVLTDWWDRAGRPRTRPADAGPPGRYRSPSRPHVRPLRGPRPRPRTCRLTSSHRRRPG